MNQILGKTRSEWAKFMFENLNVDKAQVGPAFYTLLDEIRQCQRRRDASVRRHCESAINMARELHMRFQGELSTLGMNTGLIEGLVYLHQGIVLMERTEPEAGECYDQCLLLLPQRSYPWERALALLGKGLLQYCTDGDGNVEEAINSFQRAKASAVRIGDPGVRAVLSNEMDRLIEESLKGLLRAKQGPESKKRTDQGDRKPRFSNASLFPILNKMAAGKGRAVEPSEEIRGYVELQTVMIDGQEYRFVDLLDKGYVNLAVPQAQYFSAQVNGRSMQDVGIQHGDYVLLTVRNSLPAHMDIVATAVEGTDRLVNLKRCRIENGRYSLVAENRDESDDYSPRYFTSKDSPPDFVGVAIAVLKPVVS